MTPKIAHYQSLNSHMRYSLRTLMIAGFALAALVGATAAPQANPDLRPVGVWTRKHPDGSVITLTISERTIVLKAEMPAEGTTVMHSPRYDVHDGVLFGCVRDAERINGHDKTKAKVNQPFSIQFMADKEKLEIVEFRMYGVEGGNLAFAGTYKLAKAP